MKNPKYVTVTTYQALHTDCDPQDLVRLGVDVLVLDEAHHLPNAWWEALTHVVDALSAQSVSLTTTPPYDVTSSEWQRYNTLCGPLDAEINIPELVKSGDLAPHQDLVHISQLRDTARYVDLEAQNDALRHAVRGNADLCDVMEAHPCIADTRRQSSKLLSEPELFSAMLIYLNEADREVDIKTARKMAHLI